MSGDERAAALARAFDRSFAEPARATAGASEAVEDLLSLRAGADTYLVRLGELKGLLAKPTVVPLPSPVPELLGLAGLRGALVPVYRLAGLLGQPGAGGPPAWMLLVEADGLVGLAFDELRGYVRRERRDLTGPPTTGGDGADAVRQAARVGDALQPLIDVPALVARLKRRAFGAAAHQKEE